MSARGRVSRRFTRRGGNRRHSSRGTNTRRSPMRLGSPPFLAFIFGLLGWLAGGLGVMFVVLWVMARSLPPDEMRGAGEYAAPYGFVGGVLGLAVGVWAGLRMGRRGGSR